MSMDLDESLLDALVALDSIATRMTPASPQRLARRLGCSDSTAHRRLKALRDAGLVENLMPPPGEVLPASQWLLTDAGRAALPQPEPPAYVPIPHDRTKNLVTTISILGFFALVGGFIALVLVNERERIEEANRPPTAAEASAIAERERMLADRERLAYLRERVQIERERREAREADVLDRKSSQGLPIALSDVSRATAESFVFVVETNAPILGGSGFGLVQVGVDACNMLTGGVPRQQVLSLTADSIGVSGTGASSAANKLVFAAEVILC